MAQIIITFIDQTDIRIPLTEASSEELERINQKWKSSTVVKIEVG